MFTRRVMYYRKLFVGVIIFIVLYYVISYNLNSQIDDRDREKRLAKIDEFIKSNVGSEFCKFPILPVNSTEILKFFKNVPPIDCSSVEPEWIYVEGSVCKISQIIKLRYKTITCTYTEIIRIDDNRLLDGDSVTLTNEPYTFKRTDVVRVRCKSPQSFKIWRKVLTGIRQDPEISEKAGWSGLPSDALHLNVLMFGFDSLSRNTFIRKLPKSYEYLTQILNAQILQGYNIVGDGTPQALIPILTGKTELELPEARKRIANAGSVDVFPFIWKDFQNYGYVTGFLEDTPYVGTFTYRLNGFKDPPTDHYMRPYYLASAPFWSLFPSLCYGSVPRHKIMMDHVKNFFTVYKDKPKFLFGFHGELSHDSYNLIGTADEDLLNFLTDLNNNGLLKDTLLIIMSDHGHRFADIRNTIQGKQEERLPFFSFAFPSDFKQKHKEAYNNFINNKNVLTTPFDIYATLKSILSLGNIGPANLKEKSLSLFSQIPSKRSCADAYIEPHWCVCLDWHKIPQSSPIVSNLTKIFVDTINVYTDSHRHLCEKLHVKKVIWAMKLAPNSNLLKFKKNADIDGFVADLTANMKPDSDSYQIKVQLEPGNSLFEASIVHYFDKNLFDLKMSDISRINMYGKQARCIENEFPHLRKYCYCRDDL